MVLCGWDCNRPSNTGYWANVSTQYWTNIGHDIGQILEWNIGQCRANIGINTYWQHIGLIISDYIGPTLFIVGPICSHYATHITYLTWTSVGPRLPTLYCLLFTIPLAVCGSAATHWPTLTPLCALGAPRRTWTIIENDHDRPMITTWSGSERSNGYGKRSYAIDCRTLSSERCS